MNLLPQVPVIPVWCVSISLVFGRAAIHLTSSGCLLGMDLCQDMLNIYVKFVDD